jgi:two-component system cell cycle sensor histidine kinase/response regulator CckA
VLVVDDEASVVGIAREALKRAGYSVLTAESGERAIEVLVQNPGGVQLVLLDLSMPGLSGAETLVEIRRICPDVKVLTTSGYSEDEGRKLTGGESVAGFVQKPYTIRALTEAVFAALQK